MTHDERVRRTLEFRKPDRYPVIHTPGSIGGTRDRIASLRALYAEFPGDFADSAAFAEMLDERSSADEAYYREEIDEWGCLWAFEHPILGGIVKRCPLADWRDLDRYEVPKAPLLNHAKRQAFAESLARLKDGGYPLSANADGALFERMQWLRGYEVLLMDIADSREEVEILADRILEGHMLPQIEESLKLGAWFIGFTDDWGTQANLMISPQAWRRIFKPRYARMVELCHRHAAFLWMHSDGQILDIVPDLIEIGIDCLNPQFSCMDVERLRDLTHGRITIMTDIDQQGVLTHGTPQQVRKEIERVVRLLGHPDGGLILRAFLQVNVPLPNCRAALEAFEEFGSVELSPRVATLQSKVRRIPDQIGSRNITEGRE